MPKETENTETEIIKPINIEGCSYLGWLSGDVTNLIFWSGFLFKNDVVLDNITTEEALNAALKFITEVQDDLLNIKIQLWGYKIDGSHDLPEELKQKKKADIVPTNIEGCKYLGWLLGDYEGLTEWAGKLFKYRVNLKWDEVAEDANNALAFINEIEDDIEHIRSILTAYEENIIKKEA